MRAPSPPYSSGSALFAQMSQILRHTHLHLFTLHLPVSRQSGQPPLPSTPSPTLCFPSSWSSVAKLPLSSSSSLGSPQALTHHPPVSEEPASPSAPLGRSQSLRPQQVPLPHRAVTRDPGRGGSRNAPCRAAGSPHAPDLVGAPRAPRSTAEALALLRSLCFPACTAISELSS